MFKTSKSCSELWIRTWKTDKTTPLLWDHWGEDGWDTWIHPQALLLPDLSPSGSVGVLGRFNNSKAIPKVCAKDPKTNDSLGVILPVNGIMAFAS